MGADARHTARLARRPLKRNALVASAQAQREFLRVDAPYTTSERIVGIVLADCMRHNKRTGIWQCCVAYFTIGLKSGLKPRTISTAMQGIMRKQADRPLFAFMKPPRGSRKGYTVTLINDPAAYVAAKAKRSQEADEIRPGDAAHWRKFGRETTAVQMAKARQAFIRSFVKAGHVAKAAVVGLHNRAFDDAVTFLVDAERYCAEPAKLVAELKRDGFLYATVQTSKGAMTWQPPNLLMPSGETAGSGALNASE